ncbi:hypothetical protein BGX29_010516 [Mortierella sp. GBA35]|nr:hypothetical protein BGX29_010516 [Mortierella sp. GBA35]
MKFDSLKSDIDGCFAQINLYEGKAQYWIDQIRSTPTTADDSDDDTFILDGGRRSKNIGQGNLFETRRQIFISSVRVIFLIDALQLFDAELAENYLIALAESVKSAAALLQFEIDVYTVTRDSALLSNHVHKSMWLMCRYSQSFKELVGHVPRPCGRDPVRPVE